MDDLYCVVWDKKWILCRRGGFILFDPEGKLVVLMVAIDPAELVQCRNSGNDSEREVSLFVALEVFHGGDFTLFQIKFCIIICLSHVRRFIYGD